MRLSNQPAAVAHQIPAGELVGLAPGLDAVRREAEVDVLLRLGAGVEPGLGGEVVGQGVVDTERHDVDRTIQDDDVAGRAEGHPRPTTSAEVAGGPASQRRRQRQPLAVPGVGEGHEVWLAVFVRRRHPAVNLSRQQREGVRLALVRAAWWLRTFGRRRPSLFGPRRWPAGDLVDEAVWGAEVGPGDALVALGRDEKVDAVGLQLGPGGLDVVDAKATDGGVERRPPAVVRREHLELVAVGESEGDVVGATMLWWQPQDIAG